MLTGWTRTLVVSVRISVGKGRGDGGTPPRGDGAICPPEGGGTGQGFGKDFDFSSNPYQNRGGGDGAIRTPISNIGQDVGTFLEIH